MLHKVRRPPTIKRNSATEAAKLLWGDLHDAQQVSRLGHNKIYDLVRAQKIKATKVGKRPLFYIPSLLAYLESEATGPAE